MIDRIDSAETEVVDRFKKTTQTTLPPVIDRCKSRLATLDAI